MVWTTHLETFLLSGLWQFAPASNAELYRFSIVSGDFNPSGIGRYEVGQFDTDGSGYALKSYRTEPFGLIVPCPKPKFFETQRLGFRVPIGFNPFTLKIEVNDMPFSTSGNAISATNATNQVIAASSTANVTLAAPDPDAKLYSFQNTSNKSLFIKYGDNATLANYDVEVKTGVIYEMPVEFTGAINGIWAASATGGVKVVKYV
jgi:hypothetical protein